jgi:diguanylate cyclase (GGDEF)-like protein
MTAAKKPSGRHRKKDVRAAHEAEVRKRYPTTDPPPGDVERSLNHASAQIRLFQLVLDSLRDPFAVTDHEGKITYVNHEWVVRFVDAVEAFKGRDIREFFVSRVESALPEDLMRGLQMGMGAVDLPSWLKATGSDVSTLLTVQPLMDEHVLIRAAWMFRDMTDVERRETELEVAKKKAEELARTDDLTQVCNRRAFDELLAQEVARCHRTGESFALMFIDPNSFKPVNDRFGHVVGDEQLREIVRRIKETVREGDFVARYGGDEFVVVLAAPTEEGVKRACERMYEALTFEQELVCEEKGERGNVSFSAAIGCYLQVDTRTAQAETLLKRADDAMYRSKHERLPFVLEVG